MVRDSLINKDYVGIADIIEILKSKGRVLSHMQVTSALSQLHVKVFIKKSNKAHGTVKYALAKKVSFNPALMCLEFS